MLTDRIYRSLATLPGLQSQARRIVKRLPHRQRVVAWRDLKFLIDPSELSGFYLYYEREYDDFVFSFLDHVIHDYTTCIDVGANIGVYTCYFASCAKSVIAFEPDPEICRQLKANIALNGLANVVVHDTCVGLEDGTVRFFRSDRKNTGTGGIVGDADMAIERPCVRLDSLQGLQSWGPTIMKMDIEGAEWLALQGARQALTRSDTPIDILLETHPQAIEKLGGSVPALHELLIELGYKCGALTERGLVPLAASNLHQRFWWATRNLQAERLGHFSIA